MFLSQLSERNKELFLQLSVHAALSNGDFAKEEELLINEYCRELGVSGYDFNVKSPVEDILDEIKSNSSEQEKKIITLEIVALILSDNTMDLMEKDFLKKFISGIDLSEEIIDKVVLLLNEFNVVYGKMCEFVSIK